MRRWAESLFVGVAMGEKKEGEKKGAALLVRKVSLIQKKRCFLGTQITSYCPGGEGMYRAPGAHKKKKKKKTKKHAVGSFSRREKGKGGSPPRGVVSRCYNRNGCSRKIRAGFWGGGGKAHTGKTFL